jgi:hypothetical protein
LTELQENLVCDIRFNKRVSERVRERVRASRTGYIKECERLSTQGTESTVIRKKKVG